MIQFPASPPPEVLHELDTAAGVLEGLRAAHADLRLRHRCDTGAETLGAELRDHTGSVRLLTGRELLELLSGRPHAVSSGLSPPRSRR
jgi:hypothetical protein